MKKAISCLILMVFLFNVGGYYIVFLGLRFHADHELAGRLDANLYDPEETIELKIPVVMPYPIQEQEFQRVDGRFEHNGQFYKLVKHKLENDTLFIVCIRDVQTRELVNTMKDYAKLTQELPGTSTGKDAFTFLSKLAKDFYSDTSINITRQFQLSASVFCAEKSEFFLQPLIPVHAPPPKA